MSINGIIKKLHVLNDDELFYKEYYHAKKNPDTLSSFLISLDKEELHRRKLIVPEIVPEIVPHNLDDSTYFNVSENKSVILMKHNCFTPAFIHSHEFFEIIYILDGNCTQTIGENIIHLKSGDLCLIAPNVKHTVEVFDESVVINILICKGTFDDIFFNILRDKSIISSFFMDNLHSKTHVEYVIFHTDNDTELQKEIVEMYAEEYVNDEYSDRIISSMIIIFFTHLMRKHKRTAELPSSVKKYDIDFNVLTFIQNNYNTVTLSMIADHFNYSVPYCSKLIKSITGKTFTEILKIIRLRRAEILLHNSNMSISDISYNLGYENPETFIRIFKKEFNVTPSKFRTDKY